jgi:hypothetical protein
MLSIWQASSYHVAYVATGEPLARASSMWLLLPPVAVVVFILIRRPRRWLALAYIFFGALVSAGMVWFQHGWNRVVSQHHAVASRAAQDPATPMVEGRIENFRPAPAEGHQDESFTVNGVRFAYSDYVITGGFNQSQSHGGPLREGLLVRIHYIPLRNVIVKLEVAH